MLVRWVYLLLSARIVLSLYVNIDNAVRSTQLDCSDYSLRFRFTTARPLLEPGRVFVKGRAQEQGCTNTVYTQSAGVENVFELRHDQCGVQRSGQPGQYTYSVMVIVSFHSYFITKIDRAFRLVCSHGKVDQSVTNELHVSMLPVQETQASASLTECSYRLHENDVTGPQVRYVQIGQTVAHVWQCSNLGTNEFLWVHDCSVSDESCRNQVPIIDAIGCSRDANIMPNPQYRSNSLVVAKHSAYKFADEGSVFFKCRLSICNTATQNCRLFQSPPQCPINPSTVNPGTQTDGYPYPINPAYTESIPAVTPALPSLPIRQPIIPSAPVIRPVNPYAVPPPRNTNTFGRPNDGYRQGNVYPSLPRRNGYGQSSRKYPGQHRGRPGYQSFAAGQHRPRYDEGAPPGFILFPRQRFVKRSLNETDEAIEIDLSTETLAVLDFGLLDGGLDGLRVQHNNSDEPTLAFQLRTLDTPPHKSSSRKLDTVVYAPVLCLAVLLFINFALSYSN